MAVGVLMERNGCGPAEAFELLRRNAHSADTAVGDAAREVLAAVPGVDDTRWDF
jgi:AmiR/NasT family two-component response regulator